MATSLTGPAPSPAYPRQNSPADSGSWLSGTLPDSFFSDGGYDDALHLSAEEQRIFDALGDNSGFAESLLSDHPDEKEVILAAAQAAGLHRGGIRRTAFSMGDLQALQPPGPPSPQDDSTEVSDLGRAPSYQRLPKLESVPEGQPSPAFGAHHGANALSATPMRQLGRSSLDQRMDPMGLEASSAMSNPFDMPGSLFTGGQPTEEALPPSQMGLSQPPGQPDTSAASTAAPDLFSFYDAPLPGPAASPASTAPPSIPTREEQMLQGFADTLLKQQQQKQQQRQPQPQQPAQQQHTGVRPPPAPAPAPSSQPAPATLTPAAFASRRTPPPDGQAGAFGVRRSSEERERNLRRSQSAIELRTLGSSLQRENSDADLRGHYDRVGVELTTPEGHTYHVGRLSNEDRAQKILRYRQKRHERNFSKRIKYQCRKTLADSRPRVRGRFARNNDAGAVMPHETKKAQAERARRRASSQENLAVAIKEEMFPGALDPELDAYANLPPGDLMPPSGLPLSDLPPLPELSPLLATPASAGASMQGMSDSPGPLHFPGLSGNGDGTFGGSGSPGGFAAFSMPSSEHFGSGSGQGALHQYGSDDGVFSFGSGFMPDDLLSNVTGHPAQSRAHTRS